MLTATVIEDFGGDLSAYTTIYRYFPSASIAPGAAHDGVGNALVKSDGFEWMVRNDAGAQVHQGETLSVWTEFAGTADGRVYFGFGAVPNHLVHSPLSDGHTLALVLAPNTNEFMFQGNDTTGGSGGFKPAPRTLGSSVPQTYDADHWYRAEVVWGTDGTLAGNLYDSDGVTLLNTVTATETTITSGGIAFRGFGSDKLFDTVMVDDGTASLASNFGRPAAIGAHHSPFQPLDQGQGAQPLGSTGTVVPWDYTSVPGTGRDIQLDTFNDLQQFGIVDGVAGLAAQNVSDNVGSVQVTWGPAHYGGSGDVVIETPLLAQYLFRQLPGEDTLPIGSSDVKHFFSSARADYQHLNPGEADTYGSGLNGDQTYYLAGNKVDPVTGAMHRPEDFGPVDVNGFNRYQSHGFSSRIEYLLQVPVADLDPAQNPPGTRWFLMGNLWVAGDQDVSNNSRWVEVAPQFDGTRFTFLYPNGSGGQLDFRTIPGLVQQVGAPQITGQTPTGNTFGLVDTVRVTFNRSIDVSTFTADKIPSFTGPGGAITVTGVSVVAGSNDRQFDISFAAQRTLGIYTMVVGPDIQDTDGTPMDAPYTGTFTIQGPRVTASTPTNTLLGPVSSVRVTFNEPMDPATFTTDKVDLVLGPNGRIPVTAVNPVAGSNNTQFDITFSAQGTTGYYTMVIGPDIRDMTGHQMDQNGNFVEGEIPDDLFTTRFGLQGPRVLSSTASTAPGVFSLRVTFNEAMDPATFTPDKIPSFTGPNGAITVIGVVPVGGLGNTQFDIVFAPQTTAGRYTMVIGPDILDRFGNQMDQDDDLVTGEVPDDQYTAIFTVSGPRVIGTDPNGTVMTSVNHVRLTFDGSIDPTTFTTSQIMSFMGPNGPIAVNDVTVVPFSTNTRFDVNFDPQTAAGTYTLVIGAGIRDRYGNAMEGVPYTAQFVISNSHELIVNGGFETGDFTGWTLMGSTTYMTVGTGHPHNGRYAADLGPVGAESFLLQSFPTTANSSYTLSYWLSNDGGTPNQFEAYINGTVVPGSQIVDGGAIPYTQYMFTFVATGTTTELKFGVRNDPAFLHLDDVSVMPGSASADEGGRYPSGTTLIPSSVSASGGASKWSAFAVQGQTLSAEIAQPAAPATGLAGAGAFIQLNNESATVAAIAQPEAIAHQAAPTNLLSNEPILDVLFQADDLAMAGFTDPSGSFGAV
jgi:hypothetical protein